MKQKNLYLCLVAALAIAGCTATSSPVSPVPSAQDRETAFAVAELAPDSARYSSETFDWLDASRQRAVPARLYLPASADRPVPLVVFSHGIGGSREGYKYLGRYFAANGYASLHVQHVGSDRQLWFGNPFTLIGRLGGAAQESEAVARAEDVRFALDKLLASEAGRRIDARRIVAAGHSYGANTAMLLAGARVEREGGAVSLRDDRIKAAILLSAPPFYGAEDTARILRGIDIPTLHVTATGDDIQIPGYYSGVNDRVEVFQAMGSGTGATKTLAVFKGGSHSIFTDRLGTGGVELNPKVKLATRELSLAFLNQVFAGDGEAMSRWREGHAAILARYERSGSH